MRKKHMRLPKKICLEQNWVGSRFVPNGNPQLQLWSSKRLTSPTLLPPQEALLELHCRAMLSWKCPTL